MNGSFWACENSRSEFMSTQIKNNIQSEKIENVKDYLKSWIDVLRNFQICLRSKL